jgi:hypothetical protein
MLFMRNLANNLMGAAAPLIRFVIDPFELLAT